MSRTRACFLLFLFFITTGCFSIKEYYHVEDSALKIHKNAYKAAVDGSLIMPKEVAVKYFKQLVERYTIKINNLAIHGDFIEHFDNKRVPYEDHMIGLTSISARNDVLTLSVSETGKTIVLVGKIHPTGGRNVLITIPHNIEYEDMVNYYTSLISLFGRFDVDGELKIRVHGKDLKTYEYK